MGQLVIKFKARNPGMPEVAKEISVMPDEVMEVEGLAVEEVILDGEVFVRRDQEKSNDQDEQSDRSL